MVLLSPQEESTPIESSETFKQGSTASVYNKVGLRVLLSCWQLNIRFSTSITVRSKLMLHTSCPVYALLLWTLRVTHWASANIQNDNGKKMIKVMLNVEIQMWKQLSHRYSYLLNSYFHVSVPVLYLYWLLRLFHENLWAMERLRWNLRRPYTVSHFLLITLYCDWEMKFKQLWYHHSWLFLGSTWRYIGWLRKSAGKMIQ